MADEEKKDVKDDKKEDPVVKSADATTAVLSEMLSVLKAIPTGIENAVTKANQPVLKELAALKKAYPSQDASYVGGKSPKGVEHDPTEKTEENLPSPEAATKPADVHVKPNEATSGLKAPFQKEQKLLTKEDLQNIVKGVVADVVKAQVPELVKASTPAPIFQGLTVENAPLLQKFVKSPGAAIDELLADQRKLAGEAYSSPGAFTFGRFRPLEKGKRNTKESYGILTKMVPFGGL